MTGHVIGEGGGCDGQRQPVEITNGLRERIIASRTNTRNWSPLLESVFDCPCTNVRVCKGQSDEGQVTRKVSSVEAHVHSNLLGDSKELTRGKGGTKVVVIEDGGNECLNPGSGNVGELPVDGFSSPSGDLEVITNVSGGVGNIGVSGLRREVESDWVRQSPWCDSSP